jgi:hypothetical protein
MIKPGQELTHPKNTNMPYTISECRLQSQILMLINIYHKIS